MKKAWGIFNNIAGVLSALLLLIAIGIIIGKTTSNVPSSPMVSNGEVEAMEKAVIAETQEETQSEKSISIPGFERLVFRARQAEQKVRFYNPQKNKCYFEIAICLPDGAEVFRSGLLAPGKSIDSIKLKYNLEPGKYEGAILRYSCYTTESMEQLNGADIVFNLEVVE
ncbi:MAG: hypothetical protein GX957_16300 [Clostridiaceae bacterium]|nr:hypothetical protein [Clostridiaceae bacterium]